MSVKEAVLLGAIKDNTALVPASVVVTNSTSPAYVSGDVINTTKTISSIGVTGNFSAKLESITLKENGGLSPDLSLVFLRAAPSGGTYTDNAALVWGSGDMANVVAVNSIVSADWIVTASKSMTTLSGLAQVIGSNSTDFFMLIIAKSGYAPLTTTNLTIELGFSR